MKQISFALALAFVGVLVAAGSASAQEQSADHIFVSTTQKMTMPEGGRAAERDSLLQLYHEQVTKKNSNILSQRVMQHFYGSNNHDVSL